MRTALLALAISLGAIAVGTPAQAQNYPWCAYYTGTGGARNCGFTSLAQCQQTAMGAGAYCQRNAGYEPNKPMR
jgi:Protein of unknown function (DUF3551)